MTFRISFVVGVAVVALTVGAPSALGKGQPVVKPATSESPALRAERIRSEALNRKYGLGEFESAENSALRLRSEGLNQKYGLGMYAPAVPTESAEHRALRLRSEALNDTYGIGEFASSSKPGVEWLQIGIGVAIGFVLVMGLAVAMRVTRVRMLAH